MSNHLTCAEKTLLFESGLQYKKNSRTLLIHVDGIVTSRLKWQCPFLYRLTVINNDGRLTSNK